MDGDDTQVDDTQLDDENTPLQDDDSVEAQPARLLRVGIGEEIVLAGAMKIGRNEKSGDSPKLKPPQHAPDVQETATLRQLFVPPVTLQVRRPKAHCLFAGSCATCRHPGERQANLRHSLSRR